MNSKGETRLASHRSATQMRVAPGTPDSRNGTFIASARSVPDRDWRTTGGMHGLHTYHPEVCRTALEQKSAGLNRVESSYHDCGYLFPRYERQKMRAYVDDNLLSGVKIPVRKYLQDIPCKLKPNPPSARENDGSSSVRSISTRSAGTSRSARSHTRGTMVISSSRKHPKDAYMGTRLSARSNPNDLVQNSLSARSNGALITARSDADFLHSARSSVNSNWVDQYRADPDFLDRRYQTHNKLYGLGCNSGEPFNNTRPFEPGRGRELWMAQTRQHLQTDNMLGTNHLHWPRLRTAR